MTKLCAVIAGIVAFVARIKVIVVWGVDKWAKISPVVTPLIAEAEQMAQDGIIDKADRKRIVTLALSLVEAKGYIRLNWFTRRIAGIIIDRIADKLPSYKVSQQAKEIIAAVKYQ